MQQHQYKEESARKNIYVRIQLIVKTTNETDGRPLKYLLQLKDLTENGKLTNLIPVQHREFPPQHEKQHLPPGKEMKDVSDFVTRTVKILHCHDEPFLCKTAQGVC